MTYRKRNYYIGTGEVYGGGGGGAVESGSMSWLDGELCVRSILFFYFYFWFRQGTETKRTYIKAAAAAAAPAAAKGR